MINYKQVYTYGISVIVCQVIFGMLKVESYPKRLIDESRYHLDQMIPAVQGGL